MMNALNLKSQLAANANVNEDDVMAAKTALKNLGLYEAPDWGVSEVPDRALFDAIRTFQKGASLKPDGVMKPGGETETTLKTAAELVRRHGRHGDTILAHITPAEAELLHRVTDGGTINPDTGLPEFFLGSALGGLASSFFGSFAGPVFGTAFGSVIGDVAGQAIGNYASDKIADEIGGPIGDILGNTVGGAVSNSFTDALGSDPMLQHGSLGDSISDQLQSEPNTDRTPGFNPEPVYDSKPQPSWAVPQETSNPILQGPLGPVMNPMTGKPFRVDTIKAQPSKRTQSPELPADTISSNARTADALLKTAHVSTIKPHVLEAWNNGGETGRAEVMNLAQQMEHRSPGAGQTFANDMGLGVQVADNSSDAFKHALNQSAEMEKTNAAQRPMENITIRNDKRGHGHFGANREGGRKHKGVDIEANPGTSVKSPIEGRIEIRNSYLPKKDKYNGKYKNVWIIDKDGNEYGLGYVSATSPDGKPIVRNGQRVKVGDTVGIVQNRTGEDKKGLMKNHIHFTRKNKAGIFIDPSNTVNGWMRNDASK